MRRAHVLVEGQTEETFIRDVLGPHLVGLGIYLTPVLVATKRVKSGLKFKGGLSHYEPVDAISSGFWAIRARWR